MLYPWAGCICINAAALLIKVGTKVQYVTAEVVVSVAAWPQEILVNTLVCSRD